MHRRPRMILPAQFQTPDGHQVEAVRFAGTRQQCMALDYWIVGQDYRCYEHVSHRASDLRTQYRFRCPSTGRVRGVHVGTWIVRERDEQGQITIWLHSDEAVHTRFTRIGGPEFA